MPGGKTIRRGVYHLNSVDNEAGLVEFRHVGETQKAVADNYLMALETYLELGCPKKIRINDTVYLKK